MGVLNLTPDSFSDGGQFAGPSGAVAHALAMEAAGADLIDVGGESTRPGAARVGAEEQLRRVVPVLNALRGKIDGTLSIDSTLSAVAEAALDEGASLVNDVSAGRDDPRMLRLVAGRECAIALMHMQGNPATMQVAPHYDDVVAEVELFLRERLAAGVAAGVDSPNILLDPGIGFGKTAEHNLALLRALPRFTAIGQPVLIGTSRKGFLTKVAGGEVVESARLFGTAATVAWAATNGAAVVRVHDVGAMSQVVRTIRAIQTGTVEEFPGPEVGHPRA